MAKIVSPYQRVRSWDQAGRLVAVLISVLAVALLGSTPGAADQKSFATPEAAAAALIDAMGAEKGPELLDILGAEYKDILIGGDLNAALKSRNRAAAAARDFNELRDDGEGRKTLVIGNRRWPVPFPIVKEGDLWHFDTEAGLEELINRRVGRNELNAIEICGHYVDAQVEYASKDRNGNLVLEYAQMLISRDGKRNGLYWDSEEDEDESPFGPLIGDARAYLTGAEPSNPFNGYHYKILTRQGAAAIGGRYDYIINGNMIAGFALIAFPADHGNSGVMTFICSHTGRVHQRDLGADGDLIAGAMDTYNPDQSWTLVED